MKLHIINAFLSQYGGGIFTVINELYNTEVFKNSTYSQIEFWGYDDLNNNKAIEKLPGIKHLYKAKLPTWNKFYYSLNLKKQFRKEVNSEDIIHLHSIWLYLSFLGAETQKIKQAKKIISIHGMLDAWALKNGRMKKQLVLFLYEKMNLQTANCIHALSEQEYIDTRKFAPKTPIAIIPNGINLPKNRISLSKDKVGKRLLFLGRIHPKKGIANLLNAWAKLNPKDWQLIIAGMDESNHESELMKLSSELNLNNKARFVGAKFGDEKDEILRNADAFILPSFSEGLPMSVLEAWSYKLPVLMTTQCNLPDGFAKQSAIQIQPEVESIIQGLEKLFAMSDDERIEMGNNGFNLVSEKYTWESAANQMIKLYDWVLGKTEKPSFVRLD